MTKLATVDCIKDNWGAKGAAGDVLERVENEAPFLAIWIKADGTVAWSQANMTWVAKAQISALVNAMTQAHASRIINS